MSNLTPSQTGRRRSFLDTAVPLLPNAPPCGNQPAHISLTARSSEELRTRPPQVATSQEEDPRDVERSFAAISSTSSAPNRSLSHNRLGALAIGAIVVSAVAPVSVLAAATPVVLAVHGAATPATYIIAGLLFGVFAVGYVAMSRHMVNAGGFRRPTSLPPSARPRRRRPQRSRCSCTWHHWSVLRDRRRGGSRKPSAGTSTPASSSFAGLLIVAVLGYLGIVVSVRLLVVLLAIEVCSLGIVRHGPAHPGAQTATAEWFPAKHGHRGRLRCALPWHDVLSGLEAIVVFSEEAKEPRRTIRALSTARSPS